MCYPPAAITALLTALARFEIEAADRERALADPRSIHVAQAALEREVARQAVLRRAFLLRDYSVVQEPLRHVADQLGIDLPEAGSEQARLLAYEATRVLLDASQEKVRRDQGGFCGPSPYFARAMAEGTHPGMDAQTATTVSVEAPIEQDEAMKLFPPSWFTQRTTTTTLPAATVETSAPSAPPRHKDIPELLRTRGVLQSCSPEILAILEKRDAMTVAEGFTVYCAFKSSGFGEEWQKHQKPDEKTGAKWVGSSLPALKVASKIWGEECGLTEFGRMSPDDIEATIGLIRKLPKHHGKGKRNTASSYRALVEKVEKREAIAMDAAEREFRQKGCTNEAQIRDARLAKAEPRLRVTSFLRLVRSANRVGTMLKKLGVVDTNPFDMCTFTTREEKSLRATEATLEREPWDDRLEEFLASPVFQGKAEDEADPLFWMPLMALLMGFRSEEAAQIGPMDVQRDQGIAYVIVRQGLGDTLKSDNASRRLPVHPALIELGFLELVERARKRGDRRLFPSLTRGANKGTYTENFTKAFG